MTDELSRDLVNIALQGRKKSSIDRERTLDELVAKAEERPDELMDIVKDILIKEGGYTWEKLGYIAAKSNKIRISNWGEDEELSLSQIRTQVRRVLIDVEETLSDDEITKRISNGTWMTGVEVEKARGYARSDVTKEFNEHPEIYQTKKEGRALIGYVTTANSKGVGFFYPEPGDKPTKPAPKPGETIAINGIDHTFNPSKDYDQNEVSSYLRKVEPNVFGDPATINRAMRYVGADNDSKVKGSELIKLLHELGGGIILLSNKKKKKLRPELGQTQTQMENRLSRPEVAAFIHSLPDVLDHPYIFKKDEQAFYAAMKKSIS